MASNTTRPVESEDNHAGLVPQHTSSAHWVGLRANDQTAPQYTEAEKMGSNTNLRWKGKASVRSIWPSPEDEVNNVFASPHSHQFSSPVLRNALPSFGHLTQGPSPSTSPHMAVDSPLQPNKAFSPGLSGPPSRDANTTTLPSIRDLQLFPSDDVAPLQPLFPASQQSADPKEKSESTKASSIAQPKQFPRRRQMKRPPEDSAITRASWPATKSGPGWYGRNNCWGRVKDPSVDWFALARQDFDFYFPWKGPGPASDRWAHDPWPRQFPVPVPAEIALMASPKVTRKEPKRKLSTQDTEQTTPQAKRQRAKRGVSEVDEQSPDEETPEKIVKKRKPAVKVAKPAKQIKPAKATSNELDTDYQLYPAHVPALSTLDETPRTFHVQWSQQKPINLSNHPDLHLLHEKEINLCQKLCLSPARYVYVKRRFFNGYIKVLRRGVLWNINAAQHVCRGDDRFGKSGLDVNKIGALFRAFESVNWHNPAIFEQWIDCDCQHPICISE